MRCRALDAGFEDHAEHEYALFVAEHPALDERHHQQEGLDEQALLQGERLAECRGRRPQSR